MISQELATYDEKREGLGMRANDNVSESSFGILTEEITKSSMIGLNHSREISMTIRNKYFNIDRLRTSNKSKYMWF